MKNIKESFKILVAVLALAVIILPGCGGGKSLDKVLAPTDSLSNLTWTEAAKTTKTEAEMGAADVTFVYNTIDDNGTAANLTSASNYVGKAQCQGCHSETYGTFIQTNHATAMERKAANVGTAGDHFSGSCIYCHSVDGPRVPVYADTLGSTPVRTDLTKGAWGKTATDYSAYTAAQIVNFATSSAMAGIQCENCHGPASAHVVSQSKDDIVRGSQAGAATVCAVCHDAPTHHMKVANWRKTNHSAALEGTHMGGSKSCAPCHSAEGFIALLERQNGTEDEAVPWDGLTKNNISGTAVAFSSTAPAVWNVNCVACHDPHAKNNGEHQLRRDPANLCITCHSGRMKIPGDSNWRGPHHNIQGRVIAGYGIVNPDGKMLWSQNGYICADATTGVAVAVTALTSCDTTKQYIETIATTVGPVMGTTSCYQCHMAEGNHTMSVSEEACLECHTNMNVPSVIGSMQAEWTEMTEALAPRFAKMVTDAVLVSNIPTTWASTSDLYKAYFLIDWNIKWMEYDGAKGFHNMDMERLAYQYTDQMLTEAGY